MRDGTCRSDERVLTDGRCKRVGCTKHGTASLDGIQALNDDGYNRARGHVPDEAGEEGLVFEVSIIWNVG